MTAVRQFIEGSSIYLRDLRESDANETYRGWLNDPEVNQYLESRLFPSTVESTREFVRAHTAGGSNLFLAIVRREDDRHVGNIKLGPINWFHRLGDIGLMVGEKDCWGKGVATEAIRLVTDHAFRQLGLHKLTAGAYSTNIGSVKAFEKVGFEVEAVRKDHFFSNGAWCDHVLMGYLRDRWLQRQSGNSK